MRSVCRVLLAGLVLLSSASTGIVAAAQPNQVLLDEESSELATVHTNSEKYVVYEVENRLSYASGIEIYNDGERITSRKTADAVFQALARRNGTKFEPAGPTIDRLQRVVETSQSVQNGASKGLSTLNETLAYRAELKETTVNNTTAWEAATSRSEALEETFSGGMVGNAEAVQLRKRLLKVRTTAGALETDAKRVISLLQEKQNGAEVNQSDLYRRYDAVYETLAKLKKQTNGLDQRISSMADATETAASQARSTPEVGDEIEERFTRFATSLRETTDPLAGTQKTLTELRDGLPKVTVNTQRQKYLTNRWEKRQSADLKVYATLGEGSIIFAAVAIGFVETRGRSDRF